MVYWDNIPSDASFVSPFKAVGPKNKYLTFEPDEGGWNNLRMAMETTVATAHAMGRTLVMSPEQGIYLLGDESNKQKKRWTYSDFFHFESVATEHAGVEIISTQEFLEREVMTGNIKSAKTGMASFPPSNRTDWNGPHWLSEEGQQLTNYLREFSITPKWAFDRCIAVFPKGPGEATSHLEKMKDEILEEKIQQNHFLGKPTPVDAPAKDCMREVLAHRKSVCIYDEKLQNAPVIHFEGNGKNGAARMLVHYYALLFFEDWKQDLWTKRFIRVHFRYLDEIQCAAGRVVAAMREKSKEDGSSGIFDSFHIRYGDFQFEETRVDAATIYEAASDLLKDGSSVYIATDEKEMSFFKPLREHYKLYFLNDFKHEPYQPT